MHRISLFLETFSGKKGKAKWHAHRAFLAAGNSRSVARSMFSIRHSGDFICVKNPLLSGEAACEKKWLVLLSGHGNGFVTSEPKLLYLKSPGVKFMNYFTDLRNPLLKSFGSYKV